MSKKTLFLTLLSAGAGLALIGRNASSVTKRQQAEAPSHPEQSRKAADEAARRFLMYVIMPVWSVAGFLDWLWHRQTRIESTSGVKESAMHLLMMAEAGAPILTGLLLEMNAGVLAMMAAGWVIHDLTVAWDVAYTASKSDLPARAAHP